MNIALALCERPLQFTILRSLIVAPSVNCFQIAAFCLPLRSDQNQRKAPNLFARQFLDDLRLLFRN